jgi:hypothetical protein
VKQYPKEAPHPKAPYTQPNKQPKISGSPINGVKASPIAYPNAFVKRYIADTYDFIISRDFIYAKGDIFVIPGRLVI